MFALQVVGQRPAKERRLEIVPVTQKEAHAFADRRYKRQKRIKGYQFSVGCTDGDRMVGVANVARPASRYMDDGWTLEMTEGEVVSQRFEPETVWISGSTDHEAVCDRQILSSRRMSRVVCFRFAVNGGSLCLSWLFRQIIA